MNFWRLFSRSLVTHRRSHAAVAAGAAVATAVLVGALVVGDSVRGSLRTLALDRLGSIDALVAPGRPFRAALAAESETSNRRCRPLVIAAASVSTRLDGKNRRASGVTLVGGLIEPPGDSVASITAPLAAELGLREGDPLVVRVSVSTALPGDSALGERADTTRSLRLPRVAIVRAEGLARFSIAPTQVAPRSVFVALAEAQKLLELGDTCTAMTIESTTDRTAAVAAPPIAPRLADYGLRLSRIDSGVWQLDSDNLVLPPVAVKAAQKALGSEAVQTVTTYLANRIEAGDASIPYSTVAGASAGVVRLLDDQQAPLTLTDEEIALSDWAAADLGVEVGARITLRYYEPESTHGVLKEAPPVSLRLAAIVPLADQQGLPTSAADPAWTPELAGVTDAASINDWDLPFELVETIRPQDEAYWDNHTTTPKAFLAEPLASRLWSTRWGGTSLIRFSADGDARQVEQRLLATLDPADFGFEPLALRAQAIAASSGSTPFDVLFLLFSLFLIGSALALIVLLVRLAVEGRANQIGLLGSIGFSKRWTTRWMLAETLVAVAVGVVVGAVGGVAYAAGLLALLRTVWVSAITSPFLHLHTGTVAIVGGALAGTAVAALSAWRVIRGFLKQPPRALLLGRSEPASFASGSQDRRALLAAVLLLLAAVFAAFIGGRLRGEAAAGAFFAAGGSTLAALLCGGWWGLRPRRTTGRSAFGFWWMAGSAIARNRGRSLLIVGLVAAASFLILATSAFRLGPTSAGTGGFAVVAQTDQPVLFDLNTAAGRFELGFSERDEQTLAGWSGAGLRVQPGEDASCRNLYQSTQPRVLGVTDAFKTLAERFSWAENRADSGTGPWSVLPTQPTPVEEPMPVVLDFNTAVYSLKLYGGVGSTFTFTTPAGAPQTLRIAGLLKNSVLQGDLLMGEADFLRLFPNTSGQRFFLFRAPTDGPGSELVSQQVTEPVIELLEDRLSDYGLDAEPTALRLERFLAVQNTYLATFQTLGALGLLLGVVGLAIAQYRNLSERRGELALLRAAGFARRRLRRLILAETLLLVGGGLAAGALATVIALGPIASQTAGQLPWGATLGLIAAMLVAALVAGQIAAQGVLTTPAAAALRGD
ncbi:FtsX-like permease family protein [Botrimarina hoheduenensis]|uniref:FtsX-like permease family protein n=1 Tax=Botrimarina hoheduenensis TaxID=2528000 RepID=A0A5C5VYN9_9BACT|nr:FtsX-like permease family protein [Botrimarina hoheduenensis]TWT42861.1 FtsX-like permease family protein [Botrimarina hoheduenensis]